MKGRRKRREECFRDFMGAAIIYGLLTGRASHLSGPKLCDWSGSINKDPGNCHRETKHLESKFV